MALIGGGYVIASIYAELLTRHLSPLNGQGGLSTLPLSLLHPSLSSLSLSFLFPRMRPTTAVLISKYQNHCFGEQGQL